MDVWVISILLILTLILLVTEKIPIGLTAMGIMAALMGTGILSPAQAAGGLANPAVVTVAAMFILSRGIIRTGAVGFISEKVLTYSRGNTNIAMAAALVIVAVASAFINNTPVVVLFIPVILSLSCEFNLSPSKYLIPISYASILAGTCTLIGTSTNIIVSDLSQMYGYGQIRMFELSSLGVPIALMGLAFLFLTAPRLMPSHATPTCELRDDENRKYLAELLVAQESSLLGEDPARVFEEKYPSLEVLELVRHSRIFYPRRDRVRITSGDQLLVKGSANDLVAVLQDQNVQLPHSTQGLDFSGTQQGAMIVELVVPPQSSVLAEPLLDTELQRDPGIQIIAVKRRRVLYTRQKVANTRLRVGDTILVRCSHEKVDQLRKDADYIVIEDIHEEIVDKRKAPWASLIFAGLIALVTTGLVDIMVCAVAGAFLMILTGCLQMRDAYRAMQGDVLLLIAATIALGSAMEKTGASHLYAHTFLALFHGASPVVVLSGILIAASIGTQILSNNATAVLLLPVAISTAVSLGANPKSFIIAVCFGASACFATPIGYQTNLLVYGPGGYRFSDYLKLGIPLNILVVVMGSLFIPVLWPL